MPDTSYGLKKGPWTVSYTAGGSSNPGFTFVAPINPGKEPEVYIWGDFMYATNFEAKGAVDACVEAGKAFNRAGFDGAPKVDEIKRMLGVESD